nr:unnamed protein product [Callosobruchus analis]
MNSKCQVDLIDMQTKFTILKPLKTKTAEEVTYNIETFLACSVLPLACKMTTEDNFLIR